VGIPDVRPGEPHDAGEDSGARVGRKADDQVAEEVVPRDDAVKRGKTIALLEELVHELGDADHVLGAGVGDEDVLGAQLDHLVG